MNDYKPVNWVAVIEEANRQGLLFSPRTSADVSQLIQSITIVRKTIDASPQDGAERHDIDVIYLPNLRRIAIGQALYKKNGAAVADWLIGADRWGLSSYHDRARKALEEE